VPQWGAAGYNTGVSLSGYESIRSPQNPQFKLWSRWIDNPDLDDCPWLAIEGIKQVREISARTRPQLVVVSEDLPPDLLTAAQTALRKVVVPRRLFDRLSRVRSPQGLLAFFDKPRWSWQDLGPFLVGLDGVQDPGNLGTILRTAAATGIFSVVTTPGTVSLYNDKVVRSASGCLFQVPAMERQELSELAERGYNIWLADPYEGQSLFETTLEPPLAIVLGSEGGGLSRQDALAGKRLRIPMAETVESLNVGISSALIMFEVYRRMRVRPAPRPGPGPGEIAGSEISAVAAGENP